MTQGNTFADLQSKSMIVEYVVDGKRILVQKDHPDENAYDQ